jgi:uncharacterized membrane protein HdeD (DUF308 family)
MIQKGSMFVFAGLPMILAGVVMLKFTGLNIWWALVAAGAMVGVAGGIQIAQNVK